MAILGRELLKTLIFTIVSHDFFKQLVISFLEGCVARTDNKVDDKIVKLVKEALLPEKDEEDK